MTWCVAVFSLLPIQHAFNDAITDCIYPSFHAYCTGPMPPSLSSAFFFVLQEAPYTCFLFCSKCASSLLCCCNVWLHGCGQAQAMAVPVCVAAASPSSALSSDMLLCCTELSTSFQKNANIPKSDSMLQCCKSSLRSGFAMHSCSTGLNRWGQCCLMGHS